MARAKTKSELLLTAELKFEKMWQLIETISEELTIPFDFKNDLKKKEAHWNRDKNLRDVLSHLYEWHMLLINWVNQNQSGHAATFLPTPYNWKTYGQMNIGFWEKHQETSLESAEKMLKATHKDIIEMINSLEDDELFEKEHFRWTGTTSLGSYFVSATASHYDWAIKKLKAHLKATKV